MTGVAERLQGELAGRYAVERELGRGGMATVYLARDLKHQRHVAIKTLHPDLAAHLGAERFLREIEIAAGLTHPHILPVYDSGAAGGTLFYTMPFIDGESLGDRLRRETKLEVGEALRIAREVADALAFAHQRGFVHRDIKPENILLSAGHAVVADFGIARAVESAGSGQLTTAGLAIGTPTYMSPEQALGMPLDGRSDVYSLGCVLYAMLSGEPPFSGPTPIAVMARLTTGEVPPLKGKVPADVERVVLAALEKDPERRCTAAEFAELLAEPETSSRRRISGKRRAMSWRAGTAVALTVVALAALGVWQFGRESGATLDPRRVVVDSIAIGSGPGTTLDGEDVSTAMVAAFNSSAALKGGSGISVAHQQRAGYRVEGRLVRGDSLRLVLTLHDVAADSVIQRTITMPLGSDAWTVGTRAGRELLPLLIAPGELAQLPPPTSYDPAATAEYLLGQRAYHRGQFAEALPHFRAAVAADSGFALAALGGALAANWIYQQDVAIALTRVALRPGSDLPPRYRAFAAGLAALSVADADSAVAAVRAALAADAEWADGWMALGEVNEHLLPSTGVTDSVAQDAFETVHRLDPAFVPVLYHLLNGAIRRGDMPRARALFDSARASGLDSGGVMQAELAMKCVEDGPGETQWARYHERNAAWVRDAAFALTVSGLRQSDCAASAWRVVFDGDRDTASADALRRRAVVLGVYQSVLLAGGRPDEARRVLAGARHVARAEVWRLTLLDALAGAPFVDGANAAADSLARQPSQTRDQLWARGLWAARSARPLEVRALADSLLRRSRAGDWRDSLLARSLEAWTSLAQGDSARAITQFRGLKPRGTLSYLAWDVAGNFAPDRIELARLLLARGQAADAMAVAATFDSPAALSSVLFLPVSLAVRARAASVLGDDQAATRFRARLVALGQDPDRVLP